MPRSGIPRGEVRFHRLHSDILRNERRIWVYLPPNHEHTGAPHCLLLLLDGLDYLQAMPTPTILDNLIAAHRIPPTVAVFIGNAPGKRGRELGCYTPFNEFLAQELTPWVRERYHVASDPAQIIVGGKSLGGVAAAFAGLQHPQIFGNILSQSGAFWWKPGYKKQEDVDEFEWLSRQFVTSPILPLRFYLEVGLLELGPMPNNTPDQIVVNRHMRNILQAKGYTVHYHEFYGSHDYICWQGSLPNGLEALIGRR